jgi:hypothetical protein
MVARRLILLFIGPFVLLINDDESQIGLRSKDSPPRADDHIEGTLSYEMPLIELLAQRELAVQDGHPLGETGGKPSDSLGSKGDLRHQDDPPLALGDTFSQSPKIYLRLTASGNAMEEEY